MEPQIQLLYQFISELPETDRIIISLELEEVKQAEIAQITGLSEANIRVKIHRIKEKLTQKFKTMDTNIDFKNIWKQQTSPKPNIEELLHKLKNLK